MDVLTQSEALLDRLEELASQFKPSKRPALFLTSSLIASFLKFSRGEGNTDKWIGAQRRYVSWWGEQLAGIDLRRATLATHILPALDSAPGGRQPRIAVIKRLYSWLRTERFQIEPHEDPTFGRLHVPQAKPAQLKRKKAIDRDKYRAVRPHLQEHWRDSLDVLAATGWHLTELDRFVRNGSIVSQHRRRVLVCPRSKAGRPLRTIVNARVAQAASRLLDRATWSEKRFREAVSRACERAGVRRFTPGVMRHTVATFAIDAGESPAAVSAFLDHRSQRTTREFYATHATAAKVRTPAD